MSTYCEETGRKTWKCHCTACSTMRFDEFDSTEPYLEEGLSEEAREQLLAGTVHGAARRRWAEARGYKEIYDRDTRNASERWAMATPSGRGRTLEPGFLLFWDELKDTYHIRGTRQMACSAGVLSHYMVDISNEIQQRLLRFIQHVYGVELWMEIVFRRDLGKGAYIVQEVYKDTTYTITYEIIENWAQLDGYEVIDNLDLLQAARRALGLEEFKGITTKLWANPAVDDYILQEDHLLHKVIGLQLYNLHPRYEELKQYSPNEHLWKGAKKIPYPQKDAVCAAITDYAADVIINPADAEIWLGGDKKTYIVRAAGLPDLTVWLPEQTKAQRFGAAYGMSGERLKEMENCRCVVASTPMAEGHSWVKEVADRIVEETKRPYTREPIAVKELDMVHFFTSEELLNQTRIVPQNAAHEQALMENGMIIHEDVLTGEKYAEPGPDFPRAHTLHEIEGREKSCFLNGVPCEVRMEGTDMYINGTKVK